MATLQESKAKVSGRIWQSIAQSGVEVSAIHKEQMQALVSAIADGVLLAMDDMLTDVGLPPRPADAPLASADRPEEGVLWQGRPLLSLDENYVVTTQRVRVIKGFLGKDREDVELVRVQDIDHKQTFGERILNVGDVYIRSADPSSPMITLRNVPDPAGVHEIVRKAMLEARKRSRFTFQEEM
jgi:hypothetical protein